MTVLAGTGHTAFSTLPVIAEVAKNKAFVLHVHFLLRLSLHKLRLQPLQFLQRWYSLSAELEKNFGLSYLQLLGIWIPTTTQHV